MHGAGQYILLLKVQYKEQLQNLHNYYYAKCIEMSLIDVSKGITKYSLLYQEVIYQY